MALDWEQCKTAFEVDGSLRDIYVLGTTIDDWQSFLDSLAGAETAVFCDGTPCDLPALVELFDQDDLAAYLLTLRLGKVQLNCHFFTVEEIELDLDPSEVTSEIEFEAVLAFMSDLGRRLRKTVVLTDENRPASAWLTYEATTGHVVLSGPNS